MPSPPPRERPEFGTSTFLDWTAGGLYLLPFAAAGWLVGGWLGLMVLAVYLLIAAAGLIGVVRRGRAALVSAALGGFTAGLALCGLVLGCLATPYFWLWLALRDWKYGPG